MVGTSALSEDSSQTAENLCQGDRDTYHLGPGMHFCEIDGGAIFLDVNNHKYFAIDAMDWSKVRHLFFNCHSQSADHGENLADSELFHTTQLLIERGVLRVGRAVSPREGPTQVKTESGVTSLTRNRYEISDLIYMLVLIISYAYVSYYLNRRRFAKLSSRFYQLDASNTAVKGEGNAKIFSLTLRFLRLRPFLYTARDACLLDSFVLVDFLKRLGQPSKLVIGVGSKPFSAHAWVQAGPVVLNDTIEKVSESIPIFTT